MEKRHDTYGELTPEMFRVVGPRLAESDQMPKKTVSFWKEVWYRFRQNKLAVSGVFILAIIALLAIFVPEFSQYSYRDQLGVYNEAPSKEHWFGTDDLGRDVFVRVWYGARISLFIGITAAIIDLIIGVLWGSISGLFGGRVDDIMMRIVDILSAIPYLLVVIILLVVMEQGLLPMIIALSITGWVNMARIVRGKCYRLRTANSCWPPERLGQATGI